MEIVTPGAANLALFIVAALVLLVTPGPAVLYLVARSVEQGRFAGFVSDLGIHMATLVHVAAAALGLSAVLASSALAFSVVKYAGAASTSHCKAMDTSACPILSENNPLTILGMRST